MLKYYETLSHIMRRSFPLMLGGGSALTECCGTARSPGEDALFGSRIPEQITTKPVLSRLTCEEIMATVPCIGQHIGRPGTASVFADTADPGNAKQGLYLSFFTSPIFTEHQFKVDMLNSYSC